ncbi:MAG: MarR family winged helix-turn-helix transcriptional regulator [Acidimicrobiia bacterium]
MVSERDTGEDARRLRYAVTRLARQLRRQAGTDLTPTQAATLASIERHGPITIGDLATLEQVSAPTATNVVSKLETAGLVRRLRNDVDRRVCRVELTARGTKQLEASRNRKTSWLAARLRELPTDDLAKLTAALDVLDHLTEAPQLTEGPRLTETPRERRP